MANIKISYIDQDETEVKKAFEVLMVWYKNDKTTVLNAMNQNAIAVANADTWWSELDKKVAQIPIWELGFIAVKGKQCQYAGVVYNIVQGHVVDNPTFTPDIVPALYRKSAVILPGNQYPEWDSIGLLDSVNNWDNGERVHWNGKDWESKQNDNIYEPGTVANTIWAEVGVIIPPASPCEGVAAWSSAQHWSTYTVGDKRTDAGGLYELHTQAWAQSFAPSSPNGNLGWTFLQNCG